MQQVIRPANAPVHGKIIIPGTKSMTTRALMLAALANGVSDISGVRINDDTRTLVNALSQLGIVMQLDEKSHSCIIAGGSGKFPKREATLWCADSGIVTRFLLAACAATPGVFYFDGTDRLRQKSLTSLLNILHHQGVQLIPGDAQNTPLTLIGADTLEGGEIILDHSRNSHLISALLMISPFTRSPFSFSVSNTINQSLIEMTCSMMAEFGVLVHKIHQGQFMVPVPQQYQAIDYFIEPDFAIAAYFFAAAAVTGGEITIRTSKRSLTNQANSDYISILEKMGCQSFDSISGLTLKGPSELHGIDISLSKFSNIFATLAAIAPFANSPTHISHTGRLHAQECARLDAVKTELTKLGIQVETGKDWIKIYPGAPLSGIINSHDDYRIAMAFSIIGLKISGITINDTDCVAHHCPGFFALLDGLSEKTNIRA